MNTIDFEITRETDEDSTDLTVSVQYEHDGYGIGFRVEGGIELTSEEKDRLFEAIREHDGEDA